MAHSDTADTAEDDGLRTRVLAEPAVILDDPELMRALVMASEGALDSNVIDLRSIAMERLETRHARLEETHRAVVAVAYENRASTDQIHRAVLRLLEPEDFETFLRSLGGEIAEILRIDSIRLVLESAQDHAEPSLERLGEVLEIAAPGAVEQRMAAGRKAAARRVVLRPIDPQAPSLHGARAATLRSEALMRLDLGEGRLPGMLVMGSADADQFRPGQGTDLLGFFAGVFERALRRWLS